MHSDTFDLIHVNYQAFDYKHPDIYQGPQLNIIRAANTGTFPELSIDVHSPCNGIHLLSNKGSAKYLHYVIQTLLYIQYHNQHTVLIGHTREPLSNSTAWRSCLSRCDETTH